MWSCDVCDSFKLFMVFILCVRHVCVFCTKKWCVSVKNFDEFGECSEYGDSKFGSIGDRCGVSGMCGLTGDNEMWNDDDFVGECSGYDGCV